MKALYFMVDDIYHRRETPIDILNRRVYSHMDKLSESRRIKKIIEQKERDHVMNLMMKLHFHPNSLTEEELDYIY